MGSKNPSEHAPEILSDLGEGKAETDRREFRKVIIPHQRALEISGKTSLGLLSSWYFFGEAKKYEISVFKN